MCCPLLQLCNSRTGDGLQMAQEVDEVVSAAWVIPVETDDILADHAVVVNEGKIVDILPSADVAGKYTPKIQTSLPGKALLPGFVNCHTHSPMTLLRGVSDDLPLKEWLQSTIWPLEFKFAGPEFVRDGAELAVLEMIMSGTTMFNDMYWFPEAIAEVVVRTGIRAALGIILIEFPFGSYGNGPDDYIAKGQETREKYLKEERLHWTVSPHAPYTVSDASFEKVKALSEKLSAPVHIHLHETVAEVRDSEAGIRTSSDCHQSDEKCRPFKNLSRLGLANERLIAVHMVHLSDEEIELAKTSKTNIVHCPSSNLKLASGFCRVGTLLAEGVNVAIGTDGASSNNTLDMMQEMRLAAILAKAESKDARVAPAMTALRMATLNGARALGLSDRTGSLVVGKDADMISVSFAQPATWPAPNTANIKTGFDAVTHIVYSSCRDQVQDMWVRGRRLMENREVKTMSMDDVRAKAEDWGSRIAAHLNEEFQKEQP
eukprot:gnl/TRDRNA2_/TRDRNA2_184045_c0_seq1.p1 gnl/TRDRNA2_/TRDRNA2_184045_c0~~gnl/TRDRNA2_/TRDRNA2_184045_c0_seq1.p1  ORF type:complete len:488 (-),score=82.34 gnl/TRDRNA2_/TRDRNA2_184045_c0_seq1:95-1558(-)